MSDPAAPTKAPSRLESLLSFREHDPGNQQLLLDTAEAAIMEGHDDVADRLIKQLKETAPLDLAGLDQLGQAAMTGRQFGLAVNLYDSALSAHPGDAGLRFNLAYAHAMEKAFAPALDLLDTATTAALPQAAALEVQLLHDQGQLDLAMEKGREHLARHPEHEGLNATLSVLAMDAEDVDLARQTAVHAGNHPDAITTRGLLALNDDTPDAALGLFEQAMAINPHGPRTWIGRGLARLSAGDQPGAIADLERGASMFDTHIGSWIAAGWAHFVSGDTAAARERFERAYDIDHNFAESIGSLAVIDAIDGYTKDAQRKVKTALRLNRQCFSATLAQTLLLSARGKEESAKELFERALATPVDESGRTIGGVISKSSITQVLRDRLD